MTWYKCQRAQQSLYSWYTTSCYIKEFDRTLLSSVERALPLGEAHDVELKRTRGVDKEVLLLRAILRYAFNTTSGQRG